MVAFITKIQRNSLFQQDDNEDWCYKPVEDHTIQKDRVEWFGTTQARDFKMIHDIEHKLSHIVEPTQQVKFDVDAIMEPVDQADQKHSQRNFRNTTRIATLTAVQLAWMTVRMNESRDNHKGKTGRRHELRRWHKKKKTSRPMPSPLPHQASIKKTLNLWLYRFIS